MKFLLLGKGQKMKHVKENETLIGDLTTETCGKMQRCWKMEIGDLV
jgi:hypothetical protein